MPNDPVAGAGSTVKEQPYYLSVKWPRDDDAVLADHRVRPAAAVPTSPRIWRSTRTPASPDYGQMRVLRMSDTTQIDGPGQTANAITTNETVAERLRPFLTRGPPAPRTATC